MWWAEPRPWAGETFLHHLPRHVWTGSALPACLLTQASKCQACAVPPQPASPPVRLRYLSLLARAERDGEPWQRETRGTIKIYLPRNSSDCEMHSRVRHSLTQTFLSWVLFY